MTREAQSHRRHVQFRRAARYLLLANRFPRRGDCCEGELLQLAKLPHGVLLDILEFAKPDGFERMQIVAVQAEQAAAPVVLT